MYSSLEYSLHYCLRSPLNYRVNVDKCNRLDAIIIYIMKIFSFSISRDARNALSSMKTSRSLFLRLCKVFILCFDSCVIWRLTNGSVNALHLKFVNL